jgi:hypothetical protein
MTTMNRRAVGGGLALAMLGGGALAQAGDTKLVEASKIFPYLDLYLGIDPAKRSRFVMAYYLKINGKPAANYPAMLVSADGRRRSLSVGADGRVQHLPSLADLKGKAKVELSAPKGTKLQLSMELHANIRPGAVMPASGLAEAIAQCDAAIRSKAGVMGFAAPKIRRVVLRGAGSGKAVGPQGERALPMQIGHPAFDPEQMPGMVTVQLARAPSAILLSGRPK